MATPTLTSITPSSGHPGGRFLVRIEGSGFELPPPPLATGYVGGSAPETVEVEIDGRLADEVKVWNDSLITCLVPAYRGEPSLLSASPGLSVDVTIRNLTGPEEDTFVDAFTYARPNLARADDGPLRHVLRTLDREMRRQVLDNIAYATQIDFDGDTSDVLDIVEIAKIPGIALFGPDITEDKYYRTSEREETRDLVGFEYEKKRVPRVNILSFQATLFARGIGESSHLIQEFLTFFRRNPRLEVDRDTTDPTAGMVEYEMFLTNGPARSGGANNDDVYSFTATFLIRGVPIDADEGTQVEWGRVLDDPADVDITHEEV